MPDALIGLGANLGDTQATLDRAIEMLAAAEGIVVAARSNLHATAPIGGPSGQGEFLNAALRVETTQGPHFLLNQLHGIERTLGRRRDVRWGPRPLDLDLLLYNSLTLAPDPASEHPLELPHPRMEFRRFVLESAAEVAGDMVHPPTGWTVERLKRHLNEGPQTAALAGGTEGARAELSSRLRAGFSGESSNPWEVSDDWQSDHHAAPESSIPKLLIALVDSFDRDLAKDIRGRRVGPIVFVSASDVEAAHEEATAALQAMS